MEWLLHRVFDLSDPFKGVIGLFAEIRCRDVQRWRGVEMFLEKKNFLRFQWEFKKKNAKILSKSNDACWNHDSKKKGNSFILSLNHLTVVLRWKRDGCESCAEADPFRFLLQSPDTSHLSALRLTLDPVSCKMTYYGLMIPPPPLL